MDEDTNSMNPGGSFPPAMLEVEEPEIEIAEDAKAAQTVEQVALEVIQGRWGIGQSRRMKLAQAGYNAKEVEEYVTKIRNQS